MKASKPEKGKAEKEENSSKYIGAFPSFPPDPCQAADVCLDSQPILKKPRNIKKLYV